MTEDKMSMDEYKEALDVEKKNAEVDME